MASSHTITSGNETRHTLGVSLYKTQKETEREEKEEGKLHQTSRALKARNSENMHASTQEKDLPRD